jgi:hypothetical protein
VSDAIEVVIVGSRLLVSDRGAGGRTGATQGQAAGEGDRAAADRLVAHLRRLGVVCRREFTSPCG